MNVKYKTIAFDKKAMYMAKCDYWEDYGTPAYTHEDVNIIYKSYTSDSAANTIASYKLQKKAMLKHWHQMNEYKLWSKTTQDINVKDYFTQATTNIAWVNDALAWKEMAAFSGCKQMPLITPQQRMQELLRERRAPVMVRSRGQSIIQAPDAREQRARETLKMMIGEEAFRKFLKDGFISVQNDISKMVYQIFPGHGFTKVYQDGKLIERLCIVLRGGFTETDHMITRYLLAVNHEKRLWELSNKHGAFVERSQPNIVAIDSRPLNVIMAGFRLAA